MPSIASKEVQVNSPVVETQGITQDLMKLVIQDSKWRLIWDVLGWPGSAEVCPYIIQDVETGDFEESFEIPSPTDQELLLKSKRCTEQNRCDTCRMIRAGKQRLLKEQNAVFKNDNGGDDDDNGNDEDRRNEGKHGQEEDMNGGAPGNGTTTSKSSGLLGDPFMGWSGDGCNSWIVAMASLVHFYAHAQIKRVLMHIRLDGRSHDGDNSLGKDLGAIERSRPVLVGAA